MRVLAKVGMWSIKEIAKSEKNGFYYIAEKAKKNEKTGEWESQSIFLALSEFPALAELLMIAFGKAAKEQAEARNASLQQGL